MRLLNKSDAWQSTLLWHQTRADITVNAATIAAFLVGLPMLSLSLQLRVSPPPMGGGGHLPCSMLQTTLTWRNLVGFPTTLC